MQSAPAGWPADNAELAPTATVTHEVGGQQVSVEPESWTVRRELTTDLPDQVQSAAGQSVASALVSLAQEPAIAARNAWSPWQGRRVVLQPTGGPIQLQAGFSGAEIPLFVGRTADATGDVRSPVLELDCDDLAATLREPATLPAVARQMPSAEGDVPTTLYTGLTALWAVDAILRTGGFCATPPPIAGAGLSLTLQQAIWPEAGTLTRADRGDDTPPRFTGISWGGRRAQAWQAPTTGTFTAAAHIRPTVPLPDIHVCGRVDGSTGTCTVDLLAGSSTESRLTITITATQITVRIRAAAIDVSETYAWGGGPWDVRTTRLTATTVRVTVDTDAGQSTDDLTTGGYGGYGATATVTMAAGDLSLAGLQVAPRQATPVAVGHTPTADLDPSLSIIDGTPGVEAATQWEALRDLARAELAVIHVDEVGVAIWRNRASLRGVATTPVEVTARDSIIGLQWWSSIQQLRCEVRVPVMPVALHVGGDYTRTVWQLTSVQRVFERGRIPMTILAELTAVPIGLDTTWTRSNTPSTGSVYSARPNPDGSGTLRSLRITTEQITPRLVKLVIRTDTAHTTPSWIVNSSGDPHMLLRALATIDQPDNAEAYAVATNDVDTACGEVVLQVPPSRWVQDMGTAQQLAWWLAEQTRQPQPILREVPVVPGPDTLRLQLGDVVELVDPDVMQARVRCVVFGITLSGGPGRLEQSLKVRGLPYIFADFTAEWSGETFDDFNDEWSGETFADFNDNPWRDDDA